LAGLGPSIQTVFTGAECRLAGQHTLQAFFDELFADAFHGGPSASHRVHNFGIGFGGLVFCFIREQENPSPRQFPHGRFS
jgi:hypothetical protein